jgi:hypothetical protein
MVAELVALAAVILMVGAESLHVNRVRRLAALAFGPKRRPAPWTLLAPVLRVVAAASLAWGLAELFLLKPKVHKIGVIPESELRDLLLVQTVTMIPGESTVDRLTRREYALMACGMGAGVLSLLPVLLHLAGTSWRPGVRVKR